MSNDKTPLTPGEQAREAHDEQQHLAAAGIGSPDMAAEREAAVGGDGDDAAAPLSAEAEPIEIEEELAPDVRMTRGELVRRRFMRNKTALFGIAMLIVIIAFAIFGPMISKWSFHEIDYGAFYAPPGSEHWFGATQAGRDVFAMTAEGLRKSLIIGLAVAGLQTSIAAVIGSMAAYFGGWFDKVALWVIDLLLVVPSFLMIAILSQQAGAARGSILMFIFLLSIFGWMLSSRVVRSLTLSVRNAEYVTAAKYMSVPPMTIIFRHILPNISSLLIIDATLGVASAVLSETALSFFGFGVQAPNVSLGTLIAEGQRAATTFPWIFLAPATVLVLMLISVNFIGDGVRDALDPSSKSGGTA